MVIVRLNTQSVHRNQFHEIHPLPAPTKISAEEAAQVKRTWDTFAGKDVSDNGCPT